MPAKRKHTYRVATLNVAEGHVRRFWLTALTISAFFSPKGTYAPSKGTYGFGYYFFAEVWPALLGAGSG